MQGFSNVRFGEGMVQWSILKSIPTECYGFYFLRLSSCEIEDFSILPATNINGGILKDISCSESVFIHTLFLFMLIQYFVKTFKKIFNLDSSAVPVSPTSSMLALSSTTSLCAEEGTSIGTTRTSITPIEIQPELVELEFYSTSAFDSTSCNISLNSEVVASINSQAVSCDVAGKHCLPKCKCMDLYYAISVYNKSD